MAKVITVSIPDDRAEVLQYLESLPHGRRSEAVVVALEGHLQNGNGQPPVTLEVIYERVSVIFERLLSLTETLESGRLFVAGPPPDAEPPLEFEKNHALENALAGFLKGE